MGNVEKLIEVVRTYPILYDLSHEDYKNGRKKDKIWTQIGKELNESGEQTKKKWKNLRDTYAKYVRRNKTKTGQAANSTKKWVWADQMKAFDRYFTHAQTSSNIGDIDIVNSVSNTESAEDLEHRNAQSEHSENDLTENASATEIQETCTEFTNDVQTPHSTPLPASDVVTLNPKTSRRQNSGRKRNSETPSVGESIKCYQCKRRTEYDAINHILMAYAKIIKTFSGTRQAMTKMKIAQVIMEQELLHLQELTATNVPKSKEAIRHQDNLHRSNYLHRPESASSCYSDSST